MTDFFICSIKSPQCTNKYSKKVFSIAIFLSHVLMYRKHQISLPVGYKTARPKTGDWERLWRQFRTPSLAKSRFLRRFLIFLINNCIAKMEVGCLKYPGASNIGSQPLDCPHDWHNSATQPWAPTPKEREKKPNRPRGRAGGKENGQQNPARRENWTHQESHDRCSQPLSMRVLKIADLGTQALLAVNSFKLHLAAS